MAEHDSNTHSLYPRYGLKGPSKVSTPYGVGRVLAPPAPREKPTHRERAAYHLLAFATGLSWGAVIVMFWTGLGE